MTSWSHFIRTLRSKNIRKRALEYYDGILRDCSKHADYLHSLKIMRRFTYNDCMKRIRFALNDSDADIPKRIGQVNHIVYSTGLPTMSALLEYTGAKPLPPEHASWLDSVATPCLISRERGKCDRIFFRKMPLTNPNSYVDNQCIWASIPLHKTVHHIGVKLIIHNDPTQLIQTAFASKIRLLHAEHRSLIWALQPRELIVSNANEIRSKIYNLLKLRSRLQNTPVGKIIRELVSGDVNHQVKIFSALCIPYDACKKCPIISSEYTDVSGNPFETRNRISNDVENEETERSEMTYAPDKTIEPLLLILYDTLANHSMVNRRDIPNVLDVLPWEVQTRIRTIREHTPAGNISVNEEDIPNEARIQLLPINDSAKKIALTRLREANVRSGDSSTKASSWVDALLQIPFGILRKEPILCQRETILRDIQMQMKDARIQDFQDIADTLYEENKDLLVHTHDQRGVFWSPTVLKSALRTITHASEDLTRELNVAELTDTCLIESSTVDAPTIYAHVALNGGTFPRNARCEQVGKILDQWYSHRARLSKSIQETRDMLDSCIRFQSDAKDHIMRIIGQWMVGNANGYCLGFEGPPGVGKTTLAREGLANILKDEHGVSRPFKMIALGTMTTGSSLVGHNYTYQNSQWGDIVRILMESKCMNPIIYIDELDKVSNTESGREIINILTHLTDPAQNQEFQDRYFSGIPLDMSKVLFVFSYNNPAKIDPILLDRIHRIKFTPLTTHEKIEIIHHHTIPQIERDLSMKIANGPFTFDESVLKYIIQNYTNEAGLRKINEILQDIFREINIQTIQSGYNTITDVSIPFVETNILHSRRRINTLKMDARCTPAHIRVYGMFATDNELGGVLPIRVTEDYSADKKHTFPIRITGSLGDVMKESVEIAKTVCLWIHNDLKRPLPEKGIHIHFPEGATPKDGPSAGSAICLAMCAFSLGLHIPGDITITGEMDVDGSILQVGGITEKITGAKNAGAVRSIIPEQNERDLGLLRSRIPATELPAHIFTVSHIYDIFAILFGDNWKENFSVAQ